MRLEGAVAAREMKAETHEEGLDLTSTWTYALSTPGRLSKASCTDSPTLCAGEHESRESIHAPEMSYDAAATNPRAVESLEGPV